MMQNGVDTFLYLWYKSKAPLWVFSQFSEALNIIIMAQRQNVKVFCGFFQKQTRLCAFLRDGSI